MCDAIAPPDPILWSPLGRSDGNVYEAYLDAVKKFPGSTGKPPYWKLLRTPLDAGGLRSKL